MLDTLSRFKADILQFGVVYLNLLLIQIFTCLSFAPFVLVSLSSEISPFLCLCESSDFAISELVSGGSSDFSFCSEAGAEEEEFPETRDGKQMITTYQWELKKKSKFCDFTNWLVAAFHCNISFQLE